MNCHRLLIHVGFVPFAGLFLAGPTGRTTRRGLRTTAIAGSAGRTACPGGFAIVAVVEEIGLSGVLNSTVVDSFHVDSC